jgi:hypothetical protein
MNNITIKTEYRVEYFSKVLECWVETDIVSNLKKANIIFTSYVKSELKNKYRIVKVETCKTVLKEK